MHFSILYIVQGTGTYRAFLRESIFRVTRSRGTSIFFGPFFSPFLIIVLERRLLFLLRGEVVVHHDSKKLTRDEYQNCRRHFIFLSPVLREDTYLGQGGRPLLLRYIGLYVPSIPRASVMPVFARVRNKIIIK